MKWLLNRNCQILLYTYAPICKNKEIVLSLTKPNKCWIKSDDNITPLYEAIHLFTHSLTEYIDSTIIYNISLNLYQFSIHQK